MEKQKRTVIKKEGLKTRLTIGIAFFALIIMIPGAYAYSLGLPALDLYTALVEYIFGSFWLAVFAVIGVMFVLMTVIGGLSAYTVIQYIVFFFFAISIGYARLFALAVFVITMFWFITQAVRTGNQASY